VRLLTNDRATPTSRIVRVALDAATFRYRAGQSASIGVDAGPLTPYSIASAPSDTARCGWLEFLVKVDGSSRFGAIVSELPPGTPLVVDGPAGTFSLPEPLHSRHCLFVAGGTGIAPLRSMMRQIMGTDPGAEVDLLYVARFPEEFAYIDELQALARDGRLSLALTLTGDAGDWAHGRGRPGVDHLKALVRNDTLAFLCGPRGMVQDVRAALQSIALGRDRIRSEDW
jgi:ferredoxin-NADP reductase